MRALSMMLNPFFLLIVRFPSNDIPAKLTPLLANDHMFAHISKTCKFHPNLVLYVRVYLIERRHKQKELTETHSQLNIQLIFNEKTLPIVC